MDIESEVARCKLVAEGRIGRLSPGLTEAISLVVRQVFEDGAPTQADIDFVFESLMMQEQYPGEYVVFREVNELGEGGERYTVEVLHHSTSWEEICRILDGGDESLRVEFQPSPDCKLA